MNAIARCAEETLHAHPHPALRLHELVELIRERVDRGLTTSRLRLILEDHHPDCFRILEASRSRWRSTREEPAPDDAGQAWVVVVAAPPDPPDTPMTARRLRESVRWLARGLDTRSKIDVSRWYAIAQAERATREAVARRAA